MWLQKNIICKRARGVTGVIYLQHLFISIHIYFTAQFLEKKNRAINDFTRLVLC